MRAYETLGGKPSICHWDVEFRFKNREQCQTFVNAILQWDVFVDFRVQQDRSPGILVFTVRVLDVPWAENLVTLAQMAEKVDWCDEEDGKE